MKPSPLIQPTIEALCGHFQSHDEGMSAAVDLYWLPLGAGGWFVRLNGLAYERLVRRYVLPPV